ncbi:MAG TPA: gluconate 2-dehydrogenase subunit 3 family protein [Xanthobacteraceae bacterium]|jgi:gluconate 2-dehydrogenase gamma chain|nr:gluconate 2-dehydrogenase subunit 3 family protein [Xanthobacteraceae bacterium]
MSAPPLTRRNLLSGTAAVGSALALQHTAEARTISGEVPWTPGQADAPQPIVGGGLQFFTADEAKFIDAAVARLIPADDLGPGAKEAGVTTFLDRQLAGAYGRAERWYMQGPWAHGTEQQGFQSRMTPAQFYRAAIRAVDDYCSKNFGGKRFSDLSASDQDQVLEKLEKGEAQLESVMGQTFFGQLLQNTIEGFWSDPIYGGNRDMIGWKLIGFPGAHYDYRPYVNKHGQPVDLSPVSIKGRPGWNPQG